MISPLVETGLCRGLYWLGIISRQYKDPYEPNQDFMGCHKGFDHYSIVLGGQTVTFNVLEVGNMLNFLVGQMVGEVQTGRMLKVPLKGSHVF